MVVTARKNIQKGKEYGGEGTQINLGNRYTLIILNTYKSPAMVRQLATHYKYSEVLCPPSWLY